MAYKYFFVTLVQTATLKVLAENEADALEEAKETVHQYNFEVTDCEVHEA